jgi:cysteine-rich repeat protein
LDDNCIPAFDTCSGLGDPPPPASCTDAILSGDETDVDCGGSCEPCALGDACLVGTDCESGECTGNVCTAPSTPIAFDSCINGYIDPFSDADGIDLAGAAPTGRDDGYVLTIGSTVDAAIELTNQQGSTTVLEAALVATPGNAATVVSGLATGPVVAGQNGTGGPATLGAGNYYLYVDSAAPETFGPYQVCVVPAPEVALDGCVSGSIGNGDGDDVAIAGATGAGGDKGIVFVAPSTTQVLVRLRNLSGTSTMAAALYNGALQVGGSETEDALTFTERTTAPFSVSSGTQYTLQVDTSDFDTFGNFEVCVVEAGCGDGLVLGGEQCDDGNQTGGDGCSSSCTLESGQLVTDSCRTGSIPVFGSCDTYSLPIHDTEEVFLELTNPIGGSLLANAALKLGGATLAATGNVAVGQTGSTGLTLVNSGSTYTVEVCDATGLGAGSYDICVRSARKVELGACFSGNVADGDGNVIDLAGPISGGDEDVIFQPPVSTNVKLTLFNQGGGGLLAAGIYDGQPGSLLPDAAAGASPSPVPVGGSAESGLVAVNGGQVYRVYTDIASLGTAGTDYTICLAEVLGDNCLNPEDETVRASFNLAAEAEALGLSCTGDGSCISTGMQNNTGLSPGCADCYGGTGSCAAANCALACLGGSGSSGCLSCVESNCAQEFEICSGWVYGG